ncbi:MAG: glycosyltransferase family 1 protein [Myxococcales bacterium]|nr:glycosyltransferase family 1 protein [Myxococcales bacterium]MDD9971016.1 glycosyltransferase family 1 protein [Myxococcales bacterium]
MAVRRSIGIDATTWWHDTGFGRFTRGLVRAMVARSSDFRYTLLLDRTPDETIPEGADAIVVNHERSSLGAAAVGGGRAARDVLTAARAVAAARFDLFFYPALYSYFPLVSATPVVVVFHDTIAERFPRLVFPSRRNELLWRVKTKLAQYQARRVMTVSRASADDLERILGLSANRIDLVTEAADAIFQPLRDQDRIRQARLRYGVPDGAMLITYIGGISPHKNLLSLVRALPLVLGQVPYVHLAIVGGAVGKGFADNEAALRRLIQAEGMEQHVHFTGHVEDSELVALLNGSSALALPSLWEGFGLPAVEAMACGIPVLASHRGSLPEVVANAGLYFDPEVPRDIADTVLRFAKDPDLQRKLSSESLGRCAHFTWERAAQLAEQSFARALQLQQ